MLKFNQVINNIAKIELIQKSWIYVVVVFLQMGCMANQDSIIPAQGSEEDADKLLVVDCLLPGQIKKLGASVTYITPRRPAMLTAFDCELRGGEYVAYNQANSATALKVWLPAANQGDVIAQTYVGEIYEKGFGIAPDYQLAVLWYRRAVEQGNARAKLNLGYLYEKGLGVEKNLVMALNLYRSASGFDNTELEFNSVFDERSIDVQNRNQMIGLKTELARQKNLLETQEKEIALTQAAVKKERDELNIQRELLSKEREKLLTIEKVSGAVESKLAQKEAALQVRAEKLAKREQRLQLDIDSSLILQLPQTGVASVTSEPLQVAIAGPSIEMSVPQLINMRGALPEILVRTGIKTREIIGSVSAPAGLQSFMLNGQAEKVDAKGIFRVLFSVEKQRNPVRIVAVDKLGKSTILEFDLVKSSVKRKVVAPIQGIVKTDTVSGEFGHFHALVIGNNGYKQYPKLATAINDAKSVAAVLSQKYGFKTTTLINANRFMILAALNRLSKKLTDKDNLLVYYAGHGELSKKDDIGYWLPVDASRTNKRKWIPNSAISSIINSMTVKRVLVIADSCYSGSLTRSSLARQKNNIGGKERLTWLRTMAKSRARLALTSGGLKPVADQGDSNHSLFANALLSVLNNNEGILEGQRLFSMLHPKVVVGAEEMNIEQIPEYAPIRHAGHESGEFFFLPGLKG